MSDTFAKLASKIVTSSIWQLDDHVRLVWITMLAMKDKNHEVTASVPGLAHIARVPLESCIRALEVLSSPDPLNPKGPDEGRRIKETENGWFIINGEKYRWYGKEIEDKELVRLRVERFRLRHKLKPTTENNVTVGNNQVTPGNSINDKQNQKQNQKQKEDNNTLGNLFDQTCSAGASPTSNSLDDTKLQLLQQSPAYKDINVKNEFFRMDEWCKANNKRPSYRRFINWLNRCEKPMKIQQNNNHKDAP